MSLNINPGLTEVSGLALTAGLGASGLGGIEDIQYPPTTFDFTTNGATIPTGWTYTRNDAVATYRNSSGQLTLATANTARFNYDISGNSLGMRMEGSRINVCTNQNAVISATTNISVTGDATITKVSDAAAITAYKCGTVVTNNVFEAAGGAAGGTVVIAGTTAQTALTVSAQLVAWDTVSTGASFGITPLPTNTAIAGSTPTLYFAEGMTATANTDTLVITIPAGVTIHFMLNQLETGAQCSSVIKVAGAAATRANEVFGDLSLTSRSYWRIAQGAIIADLMFDNILTAAQDSPIIMSAGTGLTYCLGLNRTTATTRRKTACRSFINSVSQGIGDVGSVDAKLQHYPVAISWVDGVKHMTASGAGIGITDTSISGVFVGVDRIYIGCRSASENINGHIRSIKFYKNYRSRQQLAQDMIATTDWFVSGTGQSNMSNVHSAQSGANNSGEIGFKVLVDQYWSNRTWLVNSATAGTGVRYYPGVSDDTNYWYNIDTGEKGEPFRRWIEINTGLIAKGATCKAIFCKDGESDAGLCTKQEFKDAQLAVFNIQRGIVGNVPVFIRLISGNSSASAGYQVIREAQQELISENPSWIFRCPESFDLTRGGDVVHLTDTSNQTSMTRDTRKLLKVLGEAVTSGVDGPTITGASRSGLTVTVTIAHDAGTDFSPAASISGFHYFNGPDYLSTQNTITAAVRTGATTITLTLTTSVAGTLYYGYGSLSTDTQANLVIDNSAQALPLQSSKWTVA